MVIPQAVKAEVTSAIIPVHPKINWHGFTKKNIDTKQIARNRYCKLVDASTN